MVKGNVVKLEMIDGQIIVTIELPDIHKGSGYIGYHDPKRQQKMIEEQKIIDMRKKEQNIELGEIELTQ